MQIQNRVLSFRQESDDPDSALVHAIARGDIAALDLLYERYGSLLLAFLQARLGDFQLAEELVQDVMMAVWDNAYRFEARSKVKTWLLVIARNRSINATRRRQLPEVAIDDVFGLASEDTSPSEALERGEQRRSIRSAVDNLPDGQREVLTLVFYHQLSGAEVAEVLGISEGTVKSRLHRAKDTLKGLLAQEGSL